MSQHRGAAHLQGRPLLGLCQSPRSRQQAPSGRAHRATGHTQRTRQRPHSHRCGRGAALFLHAPGRAVVHVGAAPSHLCFGVRSQQAAEVSHVPRAARRLRGVAEAGEGELRLLGCHFLASCGTLPRSALARSMVRPGVGQAAADVSVPRRERAVTAARWRGRSEESGGPARIAATRQERR